VYVVEPGTPTKNYNFRLTLNSRSHKKQAENTMFSLALVSRPPVKYNKFNLKGGAADENQKDSY